MLDKSLSTLDVFEKSFLCPLVHSALFPLFSSFHSSHFLLAVKKGHFCTCNNIRLIFIAMVIEKMVIVQSFNSFIV